MIASELLIQFFMLNFSLFYTFNKLNFIIRIKDIILKTERNVKWSEMLYSF